MLINTRKSFRFITWEPETVNSEEYIENTEFEVQ